MQGQPSHNKRMSLLCYTGYSTSTYSSWRQSFLLCDFFKAIHDYVCVLLGLVLEEHACCLVRSFSCSLSILPCQKTTRQRRPALCPAIRVLVNLLHNCAATIGDYLRDDCNTLVNAIWDHFTFFFSID